LADYFARLAVYEGMARGEEELPAAAAERSESDIDTNTIGPDIETETMDPAASSVQRSAAAEVVDIDPFSTPSLPLTQFTGVDATRAGLAGEQGVGADDDSSASDSADEDGRVRLHRRGWVNVANRRTPGARLVPSQSLDIERPYVRLDMTAVLLL